MSCLQEIHVQSEPKHPKAYGQPMYTPDADLGTAVLAAQEEGSLRDFTVIDRSHEVKLIPKNQYSEINVWLLFTGILRSHQVSRQPRVERTRVGSFQEYDVYSAKASLRAGKIRADYKTEPRDIQTVPHRVSNLRNQRTPTYS